MNFENHKNYNCKIVTDAGNEYLIYANWMHNQNLDTWQGWECQAGSMQLLIDKNFDVWSGECKNDSMGNALEGFQLLDKTICQRNRCTGSTDDLTVAKKKTS